MEQTKSRIEALLFASPGPLSVKRIQEILGDLPSEAVAEGISSLQSEYKERAFDVVQIAGGYQLQTKVEFADVVQKLRKAPDRKLSPAALDTLAIIAYKQPVGRAEIEAIRGVQSGEILRGLLERKLIRISGRADQPGAPLLYGTTQEFLEVFGLSTTKELPRPEELK